MNSRTGKSIRILDNLIWKEYQKKSRYKKYKLDNREELKIIVKEIFKVVSEKILSNTGGVFIRGFGYLFNWKIPNNKLLYSTTVAGKEVEKNFNYYTKNYMYSPTFVPVKKLEGWSMDNTFNRQFKKNLKTELVNGKKYKTYIYSFQNLLT